MYRNSPLISIIIPVYNAEPFLKIAILSVLKQDYGNIEILLIDDGSVDSSPIICDNFAAKDNRIKVFHIRNNGVAHARNYGINNAEGKYIVFVDSDDYVEPSYISKLYETLQTDDIDLGVCSFYEFTEDGCRKAQSLTDVSLSNLSGDIADDYGIIEFRFFTPWGKIYKSDIIKKHNIRFPEDMVTAEDQVFNYAYYSHVNKYKYLNECLYNYRRGNSDSLSSKIDYNSYYAEIKNLKHKRKFFDEVNVINKKRIIMNDYIYVVEKYRKIDKECLKYVLYHGYVGSSIKEKMKIFFIKHRLVLPIIIMRKLSDLLHSFIILRSGMF